MRGFWKLFSVAFAFLIIANSGLTQQTKNPLYIISHVDVKPKYAKEAEEILKRFVSESRKESGVIRFEVQKELAFSNHFAIVELWQNREAFEEHEGASHTERFREELQPMAGSPLDQRSGELIE